MQLQLECFAAGKDEQVLRQVACLMHLFSVVGDGPRLDDMVEQFIDGESDEVLALEIESCFRQAVFRSRKTELTSSHAWELG